MVKLIVMLTRRPDLSAEEFRRYWRETHGAIALRFPGLRRYVQNHVTSDKAPYDGIAEMWFDDMEALGRALTSPAAMEAAADAQNFAASQQIAVADEVEML